MAIPDGREGDELLDWDLGTLLTRSRRMASVRSATEMRSSAIVQARSIQQTRGGLGREAQDTPPVASGTSGSIDAAIAERAP